MSDYPAFLTAYLLVLTGLIGLVMGSFLNCLAWRMAHGEKISHGRSHCPKCGHVLSPAELIPLFSWIFQRGRCKACGEKISPRYPLVEALTALIFLSIIWKEGLCLRALEYAILASALLTAALVDLDTFLIPDRFLVIAAADFVVFTLLQGGDILPALLQGLIGGLSVSLPVLLISLIADRVLKKESMGGGDIKLLFVVGLFLGWKLSILNLIFACLLGIAFAAVQKKYGPTLQPADSEAPQTEVPEGAFPFGPSICLAVFLTYLVGGSLLRAYLGLIY